MSKPIKFLLWSASSKSGHKAQALGKKASKLIENRINSDGGIGGQSVKIYFEDIPHIKAGADQEAQEHYEGLLQKNDFTFATSPGAFASIGETKTNNIKKVSSKTTLLFNTTALSKNIDFKSLNLFDLRSNAFSDPSKGYVEKMNDLRKLVNKEKVFHISNMGPSSALYKRKDELMEHNIFLFTTHGKALNDDNEILKKDIKDFLANSTPSDLINLGAMPFSLKPNLFNILKNFGKDRFITLTTDSSKLDYTNISNTILAKDAANYDIYLSMEAFLEDLEEDCPDNIRAQFNNRFSQFEIPSMIKYVSDKNDLKYKDPESFISDVIECLNKVNGSKDIFLGTSRDFAFNDYKNIIKTSALVRLSQPINKSSESPIKTLYKNQLSIVDGIQKISGVISFNIDVLRITNISIEEGTFGAELYLDIIAPSENPIITIQFNNLSSINPKYEVKELEAHKNINSYSSRYLITANFDFKAMGSNYPFDHQFLYISLSSTDNGLIIQPVPQQYLDREFNVDGWSLVNAKCGVNRKKSWVALSEDLARIPKINEEVRIGWELQRASSMTLLKIGIPLSFLFVLVYYTLYLPTAESSTALGYLTTAFLSSIALYFSTERPQPLSMTTIDVVFAFFYLISGVSLLMIIFSEFNPDLYEFFIYPLRVLLPISIIGLMLFIKARLKSSKYKPSITK